MTGLVETVKSTSSIDSIPLIGWHQSQGGTSPRKALTPEASPSKRMHSVPVTAWSPQRSNALMVGNRSPRGVENAEGRKELSVSNSSGSSSNSSSIGRESIMGSPLGTPRLTSSIIRKARNSTGAAASSPAKPVILRSPVLAGNKLASSPTQMADVKSSNSSYGSMSGAGSPLSSVSGVGDIRRTGSMDLLVTKQELFARMNQQQQQYLFPQQDGPPQQQFMPAQHQQLIHPMHAAPSAANPHSAAAYATTPYGFPYAGMTMVQMVPLVQMPGDQAGQPMQASQPPSPMHIHTFSPTPPAPQPGFMFMPNGPVAGGMPSPYYMMQMPQGVPAAAPSPSTMPRSMRPSSPMRH